MSESNYNQTDFGKIDASNMNALLLAFPEQIEEAVRIGMSAPVFTEKNTSKEFLILGMGGSAIGGDIVKSYLRNVNGAMDLHITVNRNYRVDYPVKHDTFVIASSYSGNTEETLEAFENARTKTKNIICICSGGELLRRAEKYGYPFILVPDGLQPRAALGYSFFPMLLSIARSGALSVAATETIDLEIQDCIAFLKSKADEYGLLSLSQKPAFRIASKIKDTVPVIYSGCDLLDSVNLRWRCQIQENAKNFAFGFNFPECNHNEINSWRFPDRLPRRFSVICLSDKADHPRIQRRFTAMRELIGNEAANYFELKSEAMSLLARVFDLIYLGDWVSFYLAILNGIDPTPIPVITKLKSYMA